MRMISMDEDFKILLGRKKKVEKEIDDYRDKCPHDKGVYSWHGGRLAYCKRCLVVVGKYCKVNIKQVCEYKDDDDGYHAKCIHCGLLYED